ncbi:Clr5 domain-containing protein [Apiospora sp. TS-2023a]
MRGGSHKTLTVRKAPQCSKNPNDNNNNNNNKLKKTNASSTAMSRAQQQPWAGAFDWSLYRDIITQLYIIDDHPLKEVEEIMRKQFNFHATQKMYKDHFRKWGLRKNLSSQFVEDFLIRTRQQQHSPPSPAQSPNGSVVVRNLNRRVNRYMRSGPGFSPDIELAYLLSSMNRPWYLRSPGNMGHAEQSIYMIKTYVTAMDTMSSKNPESGPLGPAYSAAAGKTYYWITLIGIARSFLVQKRIELGFALLNQCFEMFREMLDPNPWLILAAFYGAFDLAMHDRQLAVMFMRYIDDLTSAETNTPHAFHTLFAILRKSGPDGVRQSFQKVIMECYMEFMASSFADKRLVLEIMRSFSRGLMKAYPVGMPSIEASRATVQRAFDSLEGNTDSLEIKPIAIEGRPRSDLKAIVHFPRDPMDDFLHGWAETRPPSASPSPSATSSSDETTTPTSTESGGEEQGSNRAESPQIFPEDLTAIIMNKVIEETSVELHHGNFSVTARMMDLKKCFNPSADYSDIEELRDAYESLVKFYAEDPNIYLQ